MPWLLKGRKWRKNAAFVVASTSEHYIIAHKMVLSPLSFLLSLQLHPYL
jgi:hypothetical protein